jgi:hypothetical protein
VLRRLATDGRGVCRLGRQGGGLRRRCDWESTVAPTAPEGGAAGSYARQPVVVGPAELGSPAIGSGVDAAVAARSEASGQLAAVP